LKSLVVDGTQLREASQYEEAEPLLQEAVEVAEDTFGPDSFETAKALNELGVLGKYDGQFERSETAYRRALRIVEQTSGLESELGATLFHNLGGLEHARGHFATGEPFARRAVEIRERLVGPDHPDTAADVAALAALLDGQRKYDEAEKLYLQYERSTDRATMKSPLT
jgi:tetratricopeptide (TPR) repeat protein